VASNGKGCDWSIHGPRALAWLRAEAPKRSVLAGLCGDGVAALKIPCAPKRLQNWLVESPVGRPAWDQIKRTLGTARGNGAGPHAPAGASAVATPGAVLPARTLAEFLRDKRREGCPVCALAPEIRHALAEASGKGTAKVAEQVEWLTTDCGATVTAQELIGHRSGGHER